MKMVRTYIGIQSVFVFQYVVAGSDPSAVAVITRCANPTFGDFQCNNAMGLAKVLKSIENFSGSPTYTNTMCSSSIAVWYLSGVL